MTKYYVYHNKGTTSVLELEVEIMNSLEVITTWGLNPFSLNKGECYYKIANSPIKEMAHLLSSHTFEKKEDAISMAQQEIVEFMERDAVKHKCPLDKMLLEKKLEEIRI